MNQYGGMKGLSTDSLLVQLWQETLQNLEDYRAGTIITLIDYSKAFQHCLRALKKKGTSPATLHLVATFLSNRTMTVKMGQTQSTPREVWGGCPQGTILGVFLFNTRVVKTYLKNYLLKNSSYMIRTNKTFLPRSHPKTRDEAPCWTDSPVALPGDRRTTRQSRRLDTTDGAYTPVPYERNTKTEAKWTYRLAALLRYIDDGFTLTRVNFENSFGMTVNGVLHRVKHAIQAQNIFHHLVRRAEEISMVVNSSKTAMICVSDALAYEANAFILDGDSNRIGCQPTMKALGMHFSSQPDMWAKLTVLKQR